MSSPAAALRPMTVGQILDRTVNLYRRNFLLFFGIAALPSALWLVAQLALQLLGLAGSVAEPVQEGGEQAVATGAGAMVGEEYAIVVGVVVIIIAAIVYLLGYALSMAATIHAVSAVHLGRSIGIREAYTKLKGRVLRLLNVMLSVILRVFGGAMLLVLLSIAFAGAAIALLTAWLGTAGTIIGSLLAFAFAIAGVMLAVTLFVRYSVAVQACVLENVKARQALRRSVALTKGGRKRILAIWTVVVVLTYVIMLPMMVPVWILMVSLGEGALTAQVVNYLVSFFAGTLVAPIGAIALSLVYYDERVRKEALDIELMMAALDQPHNPNAPAPGYAG